jgi:DNA-binding NarL/FixJ family response regulator
MENHKHFTLYHKLPGWYELEAMTNYQTSMILVTSLQWINVVPGIPVFIDFLKVHRQFRVMCFIRPTDGLSMPELLTSGISSIIDWTATREEFLFGLQEICDGRLYVTSRLPDDFSEHQVDNRNNKQDISLTHRELDVLKLSCQGFIDKEI